MAAFETEFLGREEIAEGTMAFHLARPGGFAFKAGQSVNVGLVDPPETDAKGNRRSFSIVTAPFERELVIATRMRDTAFKRVLKTMPAGTRLALRGPAGLFTLDEGDPAPAVFLAGGIGITPFVSILRQAAEDKLPRRLVLFYSNRRPEDAAFLEELTGLQGANSHYKFVGTMTEMHKSSRPWKGETAFLDRAMIERHAGELAGAVYYTAGPPAMVEAMRTMLEGVGVKKEAVRSDEFFGY
jgi:ferredoxin-NADP reductase